MREPFALATSLPNEVHVLFRGDTLGTQSIKLCRALKLKNRLASRLGRIDQLIIAHNSSIKDHSEYDARDLYKQRMLLAQQLVQLKVDISSANAAVQNQIYEIAECKSLCATLAKVNSQHGPHTKSYGESLQMYEAQFRKADLDKEIRKVEREVDRLQDELDEFNHKTHIQVDTTILNPSDEL
jgi:chromosome segregation ATPase